MSLTVAKPCSPHCLRCRHNQSTIQLSLGMLPWVSFLLKRVREAAICTLNSLQYEVGIWRCSYNGHLNSEVWSALVHVLVQPLYPTLLPGLLFLSSWSATRFTYFLQVAGPPASPGDRIATQMSHGSKLMTYSANNLWKWYSWVN